MMSQQGKTKFSPGQSRAVGASFPQDSIKEIQLNFVEALNQMQVTLSKQIEGLADKLEGLDNKFNDTKKDLLEVVKITKSIEYKLKLTESKVGDLELKQGEFNNKLAQIEMGQAECVLRFLNIPEEKNECLLKLMAEALTDIVGMENEEIEKEIDSIYRINTLYAKKNDLPREVPVKFARRLIKERVWREVKETQLMIKGVKIKIMKEVPWLIRSRRREYSKLAEKLQEKGIMYRWLIPEGMLFTYANTRYRIDSVFKLEDFIRNHTRNWQRKARSKNSKDTEDTAVQNEFAQLTDPPYSNEREEGEVAQEEESLHRETRLQKKKKTQLIE